MQIHQNLTGGANIYLDKEEDNTAIPAPIQGVIRTAKISKVTIEYTDDSGEVYQIIQAA